MKRKAAFCVGAAFLAVAVAIGALIPSTNARAADPVHVKWFIVSQQKASAEALIPPFEQANPNIKIDVSYATAAQHASLLLTQIGGGNAPDVWWAPPANGLPSATKALAAKGQLLDLSKRPWAKKVDANFRPSISFRGKLYAVPMDATMFGIVYNKTLFDKLGLKIPETQADLLADCKKAKAGGKVMFIEGVKSSGTILTSVSYANGVASKDPKWFAKRRKNKAKFATTAAWKKATQRILDMKNAGCFQDGAAGVDVGGTLGPLSQSVGVGQIAGIHLIGALKTVAPGLNWRFMPLPGDTKASTRLSVFGGSTFSVYAKTPRKDAALKFVDYLATPKVTAQWTKLNGTVPISTLKTHKFSGAMSGVKELAKAKRVIASTSAEFWNSDLNVASIAGWSGMWTGQKSITDYLGDLDKAWAKGQV